MLAVTSSPTCKTFYARTHAGVSLWLGPCNSRRNSVLPSLIFVANCSNSPVSTAGARSPFAARIIGRPALGGSDTKRLTGIAICCMLDGNIVTAFTKKSSQPFRVNRWAHNNRRRLAAPSLRLSRQTRERLPLAMTKSSRPSLRKRVEHSISTGNCPLAEWC